jgi:hypothetical protein
MYRIEDIEKIDANLNKIKDGAALEYKTFNEPTLNEMTNVVKVIKQYIVKNKKIVYGGFAQNLLLINKNKEESFYKEIDGVYFNWPDLADIEFYSENPIQDVINLTQELYNAKFNHVEGKEGVHPETYKIFVNFMNYCDISYISPNIYRNMPIIEINGIRCTHPHFMMVDAYRVLTDPMTSYWRLDKSIKRFQKILKYYPLDNSLLEKKYEFKSSQDILNKIRKNIIRNSKCIVVGFYAFNYYVKKYSNDYVLNNFPYYEIISTNLEGDVNKIYNYLNKKYNNKITMKKFYPFTEFIDNRVEFYHDNNMVLRVFGSNNRCIVYNYSEKKQIYFGTYNLVFMYLLFNYFLFKINNDKYNIDLYSSLISKISTVKNKYLNEHKITVIDKSPFQDFTYKCFGKPVDMIRSSLLQGLVNKSKGKRMKFRYEPSSKTSSTTNSSMSWIFDNSSGNQKQKK